MFSTNQKCYFVQSSAMSLINSLSLSLSPSLAHLMLGFWVLKVRQYKCSLGNNHSIRATLGEENSSKSYMNLYINEIKINSIF